ncbi:MAG: glycosyltransferase [Chloroflexi bacterium]|jgi:glycosyltransferase involved in cell wall biosynthesis|nr:glycosyltransferase [Chloroflexota bacterium]
MLGMGESETAGANAALTEQRGRKIVDMQQTSVRIAYWVFNFAPHWEAASREIKTLVSHFETQYDTQVISQNTNSRKIRLTGRFKYLPLPYSLVMLPFLSRIASAYHINHIFSSLGEGLLLPRINRQNALLTVTKDSGALNAFEKNIPQLKKLRCIVVESERHQELLLQAGLPADSVRLIYPGAQVKPYQPASGPFKILFATSPMSENDFLTRGIYLILRAAARLPEVQFIFAWRKKHHQKLRRLIDDSGVRNIEVLNGYIPDMERVYDSVHAAILPGLTYSSLKPSPHSALDSLAHGKPVLISRPTSISGLVEREQCGVVFEPQVDCLVDRIQELIKNYPLYQQNCHRTIERCFSASGFTSSYQEIYSAMLANKVNRL